MKNLLRAIKELIKANPFTTGLLVLALVAVLWYFSGAISQRVTDWRTDRSVEKLEKKSDELQEKARDEISEANKKSGARAAEDERRRTEILPAIKQSAHDREQARLKTQKAKIDYDNSLKKPVADLNTDVRILRERNCADYLELYPDESGCPE